MLKLKNVSKFYYNKGIVTSGFTKLNVDFDMGEFVAITGESGSGKSTLLNVISGIDTYEEGEMYINGEETSHYNEKDFEIYRRKYIGNIFQNFNLVNSYSVYQNVELVLLINGNKSNEVKNKIDSILKQVDMYRYRNTKVSKLSGGQKQRVAIARALAKDTPIIIADEPTGNLDSKSAKSILKILHELSKDKLVIVVTHNYEQIEEYATRKIKMHDGRIVEDKTIKDVKIKIEPKEVAYGNITFLNQIKLGTRNTVNIVPKFLLLLLVYFFITIALVAEYSTLQKKEDESSNIGYNNFFKDTSDTRVVIKKEDLSMFTSEDYEKIKKVSNIDRIIEDDLMLDMDINVSGDDLYFYGTAKNINNFNEKLDYGRLPENDKEIVIYGSKNDYYLSNDKELVLEKEYQIQSNFSMNALGYKLKIVGVKYNDSENMDMSFYLNENILKDLRRNVNEYYSDVITTLNGYKYNGEKYSNLYKLIPNSKVGKGKVIISNDLNYTCKNANCKNNKLNVSVENLYYKDSLNLTVANTYNKDNFKKLTGLKSFDDYNGAFFVNSGDYEKLFNKGNFQSSVFLENAKYKDNTIKELNDMGYKTLYIKDTLISMFGDSLQFLQIFRVVLIAILTVGLFFISYFIIKLILKSRNIYFSTLRILGSTKEVCKKLLDIELLNVINLAYLLFVLLVVLINKDIIKSDYIKDLTEYLRLFDYVIVYLILLLMSGLISNKFSKSLFKSSALNAYREEI